jgi:hypothetical protein
MYKSLKFRVAVAACLLVLITIGAIFTRSQSKLKDIPFSTAQDNDLQAADREIENVQKQLQQMLGNRQMLIRGYAISAGIPPDELGKFKAEKKDDKRYHFLELTPEEIEAAKKAAEQNR